jgi:hypothetical protein
MPFGDTRPIKWSDLAVTLASCHGIQKRRLLEKIAVTNALIDTREILIDDAAGAHGDVPDLGVAHVTGRQADNFS